MSSANWNAIGCVVPQQLIADGGGGGGPPTGPAGGDLAGTYPNPIVIGLRSRPISAVAPTAGQALVWNGVAWTPATIPVRYTRTFVDADLAAGILTVTHNIGTRYNVLAVYDNSADQIVPDGVRDQSTTALKIDLSSYQAAYGGAILGTWNVVVNS